MRPVPSPRSIWLRALIWLAVCVLLTYAPDIGRGFIADDFGWIYFSRLRGLGDVWPLLVEGAPGFYRPIVALSFGIDERLFGLWPMAFAVMNLLMAFAIVAGIIWLATSLALPPVAGVFGAGLWILNFHGISMALTWISGRTSLLTTLFAVYAGVALVRRHPLVAGLLTLAALLSKEEPLMLPVIFTVWLLIDRRPWPSVARSVWPSFAALAMYLVLRARTDAFTPATAPAFYRLSAAPEVVMPNALAYLDRSMTFTAAVLLLGFLGFARARPHLLPEELRTLMKGIVWLVLGFAVTILIPVRSSLYVVFPTIGSALIGSSLGCALWRSIRSDRQRIAAVALAVLPLLVLPIHWSRHQNTKAQAILSTELLDHVRTSVAAAPHVTGIVVLDDPEGRPTASSAFGAALPQAVELVTGRALRVELIQVRAADPIPAAVRSPGTLAISVKDGKIEALNP